MPFLTDILIIFTVSVPVAYIFNRLKLPPIIGFLVSGVLIGPSGIALVHDAGRISLLAEIGVALLLFSLGLEFSFKHFGAVKRVAILGGTLQIIATVFAVAGVAALFGIKFSYGITLGWALSLSSTAIVYYLLSQKRLVDSPHGRISVGILVMQDLFAVPIIALLPLMSASGMSADTIDAAHAILKTFVVLGIFFAGQRYLLPFILHQITSTRSKELFLITIMVIGLGFSYLTFYLGLSFALGAFLAGLMIAETDFRFHALSEIAPFRYCFTGLFFVSIGMLVQPQFVGKYWWALIIAAICIPIGKAIITSLIIFLFWYPVGVAVLSGLALSQVGEFSFLIALIAKNSGIISLSFYDFIVASAFITILLAPVIMAISPKIAEIAEKIFPFHARRCIKRGEAISAEHLNDHVIICGFGPLGSSVGHILEQAGRNYIVLELNPVTVSRLRRKERPVYLGDGASAEILYKSGIEKASVLAITAPDYMNSMAIIKQARSLNKNIKIITRAKFRNQVDDLYSAGADIVISEELEAGLEMARYILLNMQINESAIDQYIQTVRAFGSADFF